MNSIQTICLLGAECSGKSTLAEKLASLYRTTFVQEEAREYWVQKKGLLNFEDYLFIAQEQIASEEKAYKIANHYLFLDTSPLTTFFYCLSDKGKADPKLLELSFRNYGLTFLCCPDLPFVQDGTRTSDEFRQKQHHWYLEQLKQRQILFTPLVGSLETRIETVQRVLKN